MNTLLLSYLFYGSLILMLKPREPRSYAQAQGKPEWEQATADEIHALEANKTWSMTNLPPGKKVVGSKWVFKLKLNPDGTISRYKARLVAKGYTQVKGVDYKESFSSVAKSVQASSDGFLTLLVYVDNILIMGPEELSIIAVKTHLDTLFTIKDLGYAKYFLGLEIARSLTGMAITQQKYISDIISDTSLPAAKAVSIPLPQGVKFSIDTGTSLIDADRYRRLIGCLLYLGFTRPDVSFAVQQLSQFIHWPSDQLIGVFVWILVAPSQVTTSSLVLPSFLGKPRSKILFSVRRLRRNIALWQPKCCHPYHRQSRVYERMKHLDIDCHIVRDKYKEGFIRPSYISSKLQVADIFMKSLLYASFLNLLSKLGFSRSLAQLERVCEDCTCDELSLLLQGYYGKKTIAQSTDFQSRSSLEMSHFPLFCTVALFLCIRFCFLE
ncbi:UNVERIFIED_CONTAM: Retrovirus-related Pol polyprotein from transposon RE1 [Sesamum latifolium]|uniref:Retrovirus-related Pol polyprotein from transposon RE1 n=1 Tax=Sesamum latifolium TaxID=2727402 RepID=A0AAW2T893_9LAMI